MPEVRTEDLNVLRESLKRVYSSLEVMGKAYDPEFRADELYERADPVEALASVTKSCINTAIAVSKLAKSAVDDLAKSNEIATQAIRRLELQKRGEIDCPTCAGSGLVKTDNENKACKTCRGGGTVMRKSARPVVRDLAGGVELEPTAAGVKNTGDDDDPADYS